jgi:hypothetical protein
MIEAYFLISDVCLEEFGDHPKNLSFKFIVRELVIDVKKNILVPGLD